MPQVAQPPCAPVPEPLPAPAPTAPATAPMRGRGSPSAVRARRWPLVISLGAHVALALAAWAAQAAAPPAARPAPEGRYLAAVPPEERFAPEDPAPPPDLAPPPKLPEATPEPAPVPVLSAEPDLLLPEESPEPAGAPDALDAGLRLLRPARPRLARAAPPAAAAPAPSAPAAPTPAPVATEATAARAPGARSIAAPDLPRTTDLAALPRPLVVDLVLTVEADGRVSDVVVARTSGHRAFDERARAWVLARWRFAPSAGRFRTAVPFRLAR